MASTNYINECKKGANSNRLGKFTINNTEINQSNYLNQVSIKDSIYNDGNLLGSIFDKTLEATIINKPTNLDLESAKITNVGIGINFSTPEYVTFDDFVIEEIKDSDTENSTSFTAYGSGAKLDEPYKCTLNFENTTHTIYEFYEDVCKQLGLTPNDKTITNGTIAVNGNPFNNNESCRVVIGAIEKVSCNFIDINWKEKTSNLRWFSNTIDYEFATSDYSTLEGSLLKYGPLNVVIIGNSQITGENVTKQDDESIAENGENQIMIDEPYFLYNQNLRVQALPAIFDKLNGLEYYDVKLTSYYGKPFLKVGNKIRINSPENKVYDTYILTHEFTYNGAFKSIISSPALNKEEQKVKNQIDSDSIRNRLTKAEIEVNKIAGEINSTVARVDMLEQSIDALEVNLDTNILVVSVNNEKKPFSSKTYEVDYNVKFLGTEITEGYTITVNGSYSGITTDVSSLGKIKFEVNSNTAIENEENKFAFNISFTSAGTEYTNTIYVTISTLTNESEQNVIISLDEPTDTTVLWYDLNSNKLMKYTDEMSGYTLTTDTVFNADTQYYEKINDEYSMVGYDSETQTFTLNDGTEYKVGDTIPYNSLYEYVEIEAGWSVVNDDKNLEIYVNNIASNLVSTSSSLLNRINNVEEKTDLANDSIKNIDESTKKELGKFRAELDEKEIEISKISTIEKSVTRLQTNTYDKTQVQSILNGNGYFPTTDTTYQSGTIYYNSSYIQLVASTDYQIGQEITGTIYEYGIVTSVVNNVSKFDDNGLLIQRTNAEDKIISDTTGLYNDKGISIHAVKNHEEADEVLYAGYVDDDRFGDKYIGNTIVYTNNLKVDTYAEFGDKVQIQSYQDHVTGYEGGGWFTL